MNPQVTIQNPISNTDKVVISSDAFGTVELSPGQETTAQITSDLTIKAGDAVKSDGTVDPKPSEQLKADPRVANELPPTPAASPVVDQTAKSEPVQASVVGHVDGAPLTNTTVVDQTGSGNAETFGAKNYDSGITVGPTSGAPAPQPVDEVTAPANAGFATAPAATPGNYGAGTEQNGVRDAITGETVPASELPRTTADVGASDGTTDAYKASDNKLDDSVISTEKKD